MPAHGRATICIVIIGLFLTQVRIERQYLHNARRLRAGIEFHLKHLPMTCDPTKVKELLEVARRNGLVQSKFKAAYQRVRQFDEASVNMHTFFNANISDAWWENWAQIKTFPCLLRTGYVLKKIKPPN